MPIQNHCHISDTLQLTGEMAPDQKFKVVERSVPISIFASAQRSLTGKLLFSRLVDGDGAPIVFRDYKLQLKVSEDELDDLRSYVGKVVYFCDNIHANDGDDHTDDILSVAFAGMGDPKPANTLLIYYTVDVVLTDNYTVE